MERNSKPTGTNRSFRSSDRQPPQNQFPFTVFHDLINECPHALEEIPRRFLEAFAKLFGKHLTSLETKDKAAKEEPPQTPDRQIWSTDVLEWTFGALIGKSIVEGRGAIVIGEQPQIEQLSSLFNAAVAELVRIDPNEAATFKLHLYRVYARFALPRRVKRSRNAAR